MYWSYFVNARIDCAIVVRMQQNQLFSLQGSLWVLVIISVKSGIAHKVKKLAFVLIEPELLTVLFV